MISFPFEPIKRAQEVEKLVTQGQNRKYHRFRAAPYYGGIATADAVGCCFLCAYCWSYFRILRPQKHGRFYSPQQVADNLSRIVQRKGFRLCRITGCEPILGERSLEHLVGVINRILISNKTIRFVLETNGLILGFRPDLIPRLKIPGLSVRVAIKGWDEASFEKITGAERRYFNYPLIGLVQMLEEEIDAWPAVMLDIFGQTGLEKLKARIIDMGANCDIETEVLERYPYVMENMNRREVKLV